MMQTRKEYYVDYTEDGVRKTIKFLTWDGACDFCRVNPGKDSIAYSKKFPVYEGEPKESESPRGDSDALNHTDGLKLKEEFRVRRAHPLHFLKIAPQYFEDVISGDKRFEIRKHDRDFRVHGRVVLMEWDDGFTGRFTVQTVIYILTSEDYPQGIQDGYCILGIIDSEVDQGYVDSYIRALASRDGVDPSALVTLERVVV